MSEHTAEPWHVGHDRDRVIILGGPFGRSIIAVMGEGKQAEADALRIVACVNAAELAQLREELDHAAFGLRDAL